MQCPEVKAEERSPFAPVFHIYGEISIYLLLAIACELWPRASVVSTLLCGVVLLACGVTMLSKTRYRSAPSGVEPKRVAENAASAEQRSGALWDRDLDG